MILGADIGTHGVRALLLSHEGRMRGLVRTAYRRCHPAGGASTRPEGTQLSGRAEQDAEDWWRCFLAAASRVISAVQPPAIDAVAVTHQRGTIVPVDERCRPLRLALCDSDFRATEQLGRLKTSFDAQRIYRATGCPLFLLSALPKIMWVQESEPEVAQAVWKWLTPQDFLVARLTGRAVTNSGSALRNGFLDLAHPQRYYAPLLDAAGIREEQLPEILRPGDVVGEVVRTTEGLEDQAMLDALGGAPLVAVPGDQPCGAVGAGVCAQGDRAINLGTSFVLSALTARPVFDPDMQVTVEIIYPNELYAPEAGSGAGSGAVDWLLGLTGEEDVDALCRAALAVDASDILFVPLFWNMIDGRSRAQIRGFSTDHDARHLLNALLRGLAFEVRITAEQLERVVGAGTEELCVFGGMSANGGFCQLIADVCNRPILTPVTTETSALGAATIAAVASGYWRSLREAAACILAANGGRQAYYPDPAVSQRYNDLCQNQYRPLREAIARIE